MAAETAFLLFDKLFKVIGLVREDKKARKADRQLALHALVTAVQSTRRYVRDRERGMPRDQAQENQISDVWRAASVAVSAIDPDLAVTCWNKGGYWMQPENWTDEMVEAKGIAIAQLELRVPELLLPE